MGQPVGHGAKVGRMAPPGKGLRGIAAVLASAGGI